MPRSDVDRTGSPAVASPRPPFLPQVHQSVHGVFSRLETHVGHVYGGREEDVEQEGVCEIILCCTPKRASTVQRRVWSTVRLTKDTYSGICFFCANSCSRRITNIISVVERLGRKPLCSSGRIFTRSQYYIYAISNPISLAVSC